MTTALHRRLAPAASGLALVFALALSGSVAAPAYAQSSFSTVDEESGETANPSPNVGQNPNPTDDYSAGDSSEGSTESAPEESAGDDSQAPSYTASDEQYEDTASEQYGASGAPGEGLPETSGPPLFLVGAVAIYLMAAGVVLWRSVNREPSRAEAAVEVTEESR